MQQVLDDYAKEINDNLTFEDRHLPSDVAEQFGFWRRLELKKLTKVAIKISSMKTYIQNVLYDQLDAFDELESLTLMVNEHGTLLIDFPNWMPKLKSFTVCGSLMLFSIAGNNPHTLESLGIHNSNKNEADKKFFETLVSLNPNLKEVYFGYKLEWKPNDIFRKLSEFNLHERLEKLACNVEIGDQEIPLGEQLVKFQKLTYLNVHCYGQSDLAEFASIIGQLANLEELIVNFERLTVQAPVKLFLDELVKCAPATLKKLKCIDNEATVEDEWPKYVEAMAASGSAQ